jgi:SAM-dependent methyltransferase
MNFQSEPGLTAANFRKISENGLGDPYNAYAHSMAWFQNHLYVGTTRAPLAYRGRQRAEDHPDWIGRIWPVRIPEGIWDIDLRAEIWRYHPASDTWDKMFTSPLVEGFGGEKVPLSVAFRSMVTFQGSSDSAPGIYVPTMATYQTSAVMLRSLSGDQFEIVTDEGMGFPDPYNPRGVRAFAAFRDRLFSSPAVAQKGQRKSYNFPESMVILTTKDPAQGRWQLACDPHFGDPNNLSVFQMAEFRGHLYAGTMNVNRGFQVWKTDGEGSPPFQWKKVIDKGAYRGRLNQGAITMQSFGDHLYIGTGIQEGGYDRYNHVGPAAAEIIRIDPDDKWELVVGEFRVTPEGMKVPISGLDAGFGKPFAGYLWSMCAHKGWLYAGTFDWLMATRYGRVDRWPEYLRQMMSPKRLDFLINKFGGFDLWRTRDGQNWAPVTQNGFGNYFNMGARTMISTPYGLFVGTANSFAPETAVERTAGWNYENNARGGLEVWLGSREKSLEKGDDDLELAWLCTATPPTVTPSKAEKISDRIVRQLYGGSEFRHLGFWTAGTSNFQMACEQLMEEILAFLPEERGRVVDVACGRGASTNHLLKHFPANAITGIATSKKDMKYCRKIAPNVRFLTRKLPRLKLPSESADALIWVQGFEPSSVGAALLQEVYQTLKPGGRWVCFDILPTHIPVRRRKSWSRNLPVQSPEEYQSLLQRMGFSRIRFVDVTGECLQGFDKFMSTHLQMKKLTGEIDDSIIRDIKADLPTNSMDGCQCFFISARKAKEAGA